MVERMNAIDSISCLKPQGAFYVMMNLDGVMGRTIRGHAIGSSSNFASAFVQEEMVATVPGSAFGADRARPLVLCSDMDTIRKGMDRLETFIKASEIKILSQREGGMLPLSRCVTFGNC